MTISDYTKKVVLILGPPDKPYAEIYLPEKRIGEKDRRKLQSEVAEDRRRGVADRRNS